MNKNNRIKRFTPEKIFIDKQVWDKHGTKKILYNIKDVPYHICEDPEEWMRNVRMMRDPIGQGKKILWVTEQKGGFVKPCPCTPVYLGCRYYIINLDINCPYDCTYCILQHYLSQPAIITHVNLEELWTQLDTFIESLGGRTVRIGTGELGDSLALDHITENSRALIAYFRGKNNVLFELKTKSVNIDNLLKEEPEENIIISWSINSEKMARETEDGAPAVEERLKAAGEICRRGYRVGFHFDPLLYYEGFAEDYDAVIERMFQNVSADRIAWISLGGLRFPPVLKKIIQNRFPGSRILLEELFPGKDGKYRYFKPQRRRLFQAAAASLRKYGGGQVPLYFCMEGRNTWKEILGWEPRGKEDIEKYLSFPQEMS